ncbi:hypothetical protein SLE2022_058080 [Rubroshorea leprosula]
MSPHPQSPIIQSVEISIQNLTRSCNRRQKWHHFFNPNLLIQDSCSRASWRKNLANFLESTPIHIAAISLLLLDLTLTVLQLSSSLHSCTPGTTANNKERVWYHWTGISILSLLCAKTVALVLGLGTAFFRRPVYAVDGAVVVIALLLEVFLESRGGGLVVAMSLWRVVRVVESAFELSDEAIEAQIQEIGCQFEALRNENTKLREIITEQDKIIGMLQEQLDQYQSP